MSDGRPRPSTSIRRSPPADPGHEPRGGPEFESLHSGSDRPRSRDLSCATDASVDGRNAQIAVVPELRGERVPQPLRKRMNSWWRWRCMLRPSSVEDVHRREQGGGPVPFVMMGHCSSASFLHRQAGLGAVESLTHDRGRAEPLALSSTICARHTCFCGALRSLMSD